MLLCDIDFNFLYMALYYDPTVATMARDKLCTTTPFKTLL